MKKKLTLGIAAIMLAGTVVTTQGCRTTSRSVSLWPGDRNVTVVKKPKRRKIKGRTKAIKHRNTSRW